MNMNEKQFENELIKYEFIKIKKHELEKNHILKFNEETYFIKTPYKDIEFNNKSIYDKDDNLLFINEKFYINVELFLYFDVNDLEGYDLDKFELEEAKKYILKIWCMGE